MEYVRSGLPRLVELFGPADAAHLGRITAHLIGAQSYKEIAAALGVTADTAHAFADWMTGLERPKATPLRSILAATSSTSSAAAGA